MGDRILLVTGSRALADTDCANDWASDAILAALCEYPDSDEIVVTGDARGPDADAAKIADRALVWHRRGYVHVLGDAPVVPRWSSDPLPPDGDREAWKARLLARDRAMVAWCVARLREGAEVSVLALLAPWSRTRGTQYTAAQAREAGLAVTEMVCHAKMGPEVCRG